MSVLKCKSCGAALEIADDRQYIKCSYCGAVNVNEYFDVDADILQEALPTTESLLERAFMFLEDGEYSRADQYFERVLDIEPKCAEAYVGKLMAEMFCRTKDDLSNLNDRFDDNDNYHKAMRFGDSELKAELQGYTDVITERIELNRLEGIYNKASDKMLQAQRAKLSEQYSLYIAAQNLYKTIPYYKDSEKKAEECSEKAKICGKKSERANLTRVRICAVLYVVGILILIAGLIVVSKRTAINSEYERVITENLSGKTFSGYILRMANRDKPVYAYDENGGVYAETYPGRGVRSHFILEFIDERTVHYVFIIEWNNSSDIVSEDTEYYYDINMSIFGKTTLVFGDRKYTVTLTDDHEPVSLEAYGFYYTEDAYYNVER